MTNAHIAEFIAAILSIAYSIFMMQERRFCWAFGIVSSVISVVLFYKQQLYGQVLIYFYYIVIGIYGWINWAKMDKDNCHISYWSTQTHYVAFGVLFLVSMATGYILQRYTDSALPYFDACITVFGFAATLKEARKILSSWLYWFFVNAASAILYWLNELPVYSLLMIVYAAICVPGYLSWKKRMTKYAI
jgi:nicotinamide mononucleotide transporter